MSDFDVAVIGGGLVGAAVAYGMTRRDRSVVMLDGGDFDLRASRGNFGLVWVQGKGKGRPQYTQWSLRSAGRWPTLAMDLGAETGEDLDLEQPGGAIIALTEAEHAENAANLAQIRAEQGNEPFEYSILDRSELAELLPGLGPEVAGGSYSPHDGHANPLRLLRALHTAYLARGGVYRPNVEVRDFRQGDGPVTVELAEGAVTADKVVIAAGLGTKPLAAKVGLNVDIRPSHGQIIVTERGEPVLPDPLDAAAPDAGRRADAGRQCRGFRLRSADRSDDHPRHRLALLAGVPVSGRSAADAGLGGAQDHDR